MEVVLRLALSVLLTAIKITGLHQINHKNKRMYKELALISFKVLNYRISPGSQCFCCQLGEREKWSETEI